MARSAWTRAVAGAALAATAVWGVPGASAAPEGIDHEGTLTGTAKTFTWNGTTAAGANVTHFDDQLGNKCGDTPDTQCDRVLLTVTLPVPEGKKSARSTLTVTIDGYTVPVSDFDLNGYASDATGVRGTLFGESGEPPSFAETVATTVSTSPLTTTKHYLIEVPYFAAAGSYVGTAKLGNVTFS